MYKDRHPNIIDCVEDLKCKKISDGCQKQLIKIYKDTKKELGEEKAKQWALYLYSRTFHADGNKFFCSNHFYNYKNDKYVRLSKSRPPTNRNKRYLTIDSNIYDRLVALKPFVYRNLKYKKGKTNSSKV